ncbi:E3 ubiquitin-protein ligase NHLRC1-like [Genypterus blacodes]|uniref:E3 ubiquitin-protein ligase NHLRC1-like n=1 Tax=Genypterus blacodes TaxID=154954 RepID=UPI003F75F8E1
MAEATASLGPGSLRPAGILREIQINLLECKVCFEKFSTQVKERRPHNLTCGHVLCLECITALSHPLLKKLECPFCRKLCSADSTSHCRGLSDLQELLLSWRPRSFTGPCGTKGNISRASGLRSTTLLLCTAFGGWGTLINPTGIAVFKSSGTIVVVHDGERRLVVFNPQGRKLHSFGQRGQAQGEICYPLDVAVTPCGYVVVTDAGDKAVKVFTSRGCHVMTVKNFQLPWGVDINSCGHILVSDAQAGTLSRISVDYHHGVPLEHQAAVTDLQHPRAVACCQLTGSTAVIEHLIDDKHQATRLKVFTKDFQILYQTDGFSLSLQCNVSLSMSGVAFDPDGDVNVIDSNQGVIWSLGKLQTGPTPRPLVANQLIRPVGLVSLNNSLCVLDSGDHTVKIYSAKSNDI